MRSRADLAKGRGGAGASELRFVSRRFRLSHLGWLFFPVVSQPYNSITVLAGSGLPAFLLTWHESPDCPGPLKLR